MERITVTHKKQSSKCVFHPWILAFDAANPSSLRLPTWITSKLLPLEYLQMIHVVPAEVGNVLGNNLNNLNLKHPMSCVSINVEKR
jgi:hypothetical protein